MYGWGEELVGESVPGLYDSIATFSLLLTLINLILRSNAEFPFLQQQGREEILPCTVWYSNICSGLWEPTKTAVNLGQSQSISSSMRYFHSPSRCWGSPYLFNFFFFCSISAPSGLSFLPNELSVPWRLQPGRKISVPERQGSTHRVPGSCARASPAQRKGGCSPLRP